MGIGGAVQIPYCFLGSLIGARAGFLGAVAAAITAHTPALCCCCSHPHAPTPPHIPTPTYTRAPTHTHTHSHTHTQNYAPTTTTTTTTTHNNNQNRTLKRRWWLNPYLKLDAACGRGGRSPFLDASLAYRGQPNPSQGHGSS